jgi:hypothetical protein
MRSKNKDVARRLVKYLESNVLTFKGVQEKMYMISKGIKKKELEKGEVSRGYACNSINLLVNSGSIKYHEDFGYYALPGTSENKYLYNSKHISWHRTVQDKKPIDVIAHPAIKKIIETTHKNTEIYI